MSHQLPLPLPHRSARGRSDFLVAPCNHEAVALVDGCARWNDKIHLIYGPEASGKTHLLDVWADAIGAVAVASQSIEGITLDSVRTAPGIAIDDLQNLGVVNETHLFHIFNEARAYKIPVLMTAAVPPRSLPIALPDLASRILGLPAVALLAPDDTLLEGLMMKLLNDRQLSIAEHVASFVLSRIERSCGAVSAFVDTFDRVSLAQKRPLTRALAVEVLAEMSAKMS